MGQVRSQFFYKDSYDLMDLVYFTKNEVEFAAHYFKLLAPSNMELHRYTRLPMKYIMRFPRLRYHPFGDRLCYIFSAELDGSLTCSEFERLVSTFTDDAPLKLKAQAAFRVFDIDGDNWIGYGDFNEILDRVVNSDQILTQTDKNELIYDVLTRVDLNQDGQISFYEFIYALQISNRKTKRCGMRF